MSASPAGSLARSIALPYLAVFLAVLAIFAAGVHGAVVVLAQRESLVRLNALARVAVAAVDTDADGMKVGTPPDRIVNPSEQGVEWLTSSGRVIATRGLIVKPGLPPHAGTRERYETPQGWVDVETVPVTKAGRTIGYVRALQSDERAEETTRWVDVGLAIGFLLAAGTSIVGGLYLSRRTVKRITDNMRLLREFSANAAHELRTPLTVISTNADASLRAGGLTEQHRHRFETIATTAGAMRRVSDDLLTLAMPASLAATELHHVDLGEAAAAAVAAQKTAAEHRGVRLELRTDGTPALFGNPDQVRRIIANLIENAIRYTELGGEIVVFSRIDRDRASVSVRDTGIGIAAEDLPHIFQRFWRADRARRVGDGSGLGLAIVEALVRRHGGTIHVESVVGQGSEFTVSFPHRPHGR